MLILSTKVKLEGLEKRKLTEAEIRAMKDEIKRFENHRIEWFKADTYLFPLVGAIILTWILRGRPIGFFIGFILGLFPFGILPYFIKGDSKLIKKDLEDGYTRIKIVPLVIEELDNRAALGSGAGYQKRY